MSRRMKYVIIGSIIGCVLRLLAVYVEERAKDESTSSVSDRFNTMAMRELWNDLRERRAR